jgi:hypothetical protein
MIKSKIKNKIKTISKILDKASSQMLINVSNFYNLYLFLELIAPTRFSAKPNFGSTFGNFQQDRNMPGFISEETRLGRTTFSHFGKSSNWSESGLNAKLTF